MHRSARLLLSSFWSVIRAAHDAKACVGLRILPPMQSASCDCQAFSCLHPLWGSLHAPSCTSNVCCRPSAAARAVPEGALTRFPFCQLSIVLGCTSREALRAQACGDSWRGSRLWQVLRQWRKQRRCWLLPGRFVSPFQPDRQADEEPGHVPAHQHASRMRSSNRTQRPRARRPCGGALCAGALCSDGSSRLHLCGAVIVHPRFRHTLADPPVAADPPRPLDWHDLPCEVGAAPSWPCKLLRGESSSQFYIPCPAPFEGMFTCHPHGPESRLASVFSEDAAACGPLGCVHQPVGALLSVHSPTPRSRRLPLGRLWSSWLATWTRRRTCWHSALSAGPPGAPRHAGSAGSCSGRAQHGSIHLDPPGARVLTPPLTHAPSAAGRWPATMRCGRGCAAASLTCLKSPLALGRHHHQASGATSTASTTRYSWQACCCGPPVPAVALQSRPCPPIFFNGPPAGPASTTQAGCLRPTACMHSPAPLLVRSGLLRPSPHLSPPSRAAAGHGAGHGAEHEQRAWRPGTLWQRPHGHPAGLRPQRAGFNPSLPAAGPGPWPIWCASTCHMLLTSLTQTVTAAVVCGLAVGAKCLDKAVPLTTPLTRRTSCPHAPSVRLNTPFDVAPIPALLFPPPPPPASERAAPPCATTAAAPAHGTACAALQAGLLLYTHTAFPRSPAGCTDCALYLPLTSSALPSACSLLSWTVDIDCRYKKHQCTRESNRKERRSENSV